MGICNILKSCGRWCWYALSSCGIKFWILFRSLLHPVFSGRFQFTLYGKHILYSTYCHILFVCDQLLFSKEAKHCFIVLVSPKNLEDPLKDDCWFNKWADCIQKLSSFRWTQLVRKFCSNIVAIWQLRGRLAGVYNFFIGKNDACKSVVNFFTVYAGFGM